MTEQLFDRIREGDAEQIRRDLEAEPASASARDASGVSAVLFALYNGQADIARLLASHKTLDIFEAAALNDAAALADAVAANAEAVHERSPDGFTALHLACFFAADAVIAPLIERGAEVDTAAHNASAVFPLHSAAASRDAAIVEALLVAGASPDAKQAGGFTALHSAAHHGNEAMVRVLLAQGADVSVETDEGKRAIDLTPEDSAAVRELLEAAGR